MGDGRQIHVRVVFQPVRYMLGRLAGAGGEGAGDWQHVGGGFFHVLEHGVFRFQLGALFLAELRCSGAICRISKASSISRASSGASVFLHHNMGVSATKTEAGHASHSLTGVAWPFP